jgi:hypothetical protein
LGFGEREKEKRKEHKNYNKMFRKTQIERESKKLDIDER